MNYKLISVFLTLLLFSTIGEAQKKQFILNGMIGGLKNQKVYLLKDVGEGKILIDSTQTQNGEFRFHGETNQAFAARLRTGLRKEMSFFILVPNFSC